MLTPIRFLCRDCNAWKTSEGFSKREQSNFRYKKLSDPGLNGVRAKLRCRKCIGEPVQELLCQGQCGIWKSLDKFSKSQRSGGGAKVGVPCLILRLFVAKRLIDNLSSGAKNASCGRRLQNRVFLP